MEKRKAEDGDGAGPEGSKRARVEPANGAAAAAAAAPPAAPAAGAAAAPKKLGIDLEKLQKAKLALQKQKELAEKLKKAGITVRRRTLVWHTGCLLFATTALLAGLLCVRLIV